METDTIDNSYKIKTKVFEGPFGLLLSLVEKRKLFINDLSLSEVTEDYLKHLSGLRNLPPEEASSFLLVASTLLLIKSKSLLPNLDLTEEEKGGIRNLEKRLRLFKLFTGLAQNIKNNFGRKIIFAPEERKNEILVFLSDEQITKESMMTFARQALCAMPKKTSMPEVELKKVISIEEMLDRLAKRIKNTLKMSFREFAGAGKGSKEEKVMMIVSFLAMLELVRQGVIHATQGDEAGDIIIERREESSELNIPE